MNKCKQITTLLALGAILVPLSLTACNGTGDSSSTSTDSPANSSQNSTSENVSNIDLDSYEEQIAYYMALSESLKQELLILKEENYVESCEKDLKIAELEETISSLQKTILSMSDPEIGVPDGDELPPSFDEMVSRQDYEYKESDGKIIITRYVGSADEIEIPSEINGLPVYKIGDEAFKGTPVHSAILPSSVTEIGWFAFDGCTQLETVSLPPSVISIGYGAFNSCPSSMIIICKADSYAESYAKSWGIRVNLK